VRTHPLNALQVILETIFTANLLTGTKHPENNNNTKSMNMSNICTD